MRTLNRLSRQCPLAVQTATAMLGITGMLLHGSQIRPVLIGNDLLWNHTAPFDGLLEKRSGALYITLLAQ